MIKEHEIKKDIEVTRRLIETASYSIFNLEYLNTPENQSQLAALQKYTFMNVAINNLWASAILDIHKLLSTSRND